MGVTLRRRFGLDKGAITAYEDEHLQDRAEHEVRSQILAEEIERPRVGPMRDIVATIQPEQDEIVRAGAEQTICVQGAPGTGKTAVGLHRAAWLLYAFRDRLARSGVLVIGPEPRLPRAHRRRAARARRGRGRAHDDRGARRQRPRPRHRCHGNRCAEGRRPPGRGAPPGRLVARGDRRRGPRGAARLAQVARAGIRGQRDRRPSSASAGCATTPPGRCCPSDWPTRCSSRWSGRATAPTTACRTPSRGPRWSSATRSPCGRRSTPRAVLFELLTDADALAAHADGLLDGRRAGAPAVGAAPEEPRQRPLVAGRRRAPRRARRPPRAHAVAWGTSCSTRRRTSPPCSCAPSGGAARPAPRPCSATSPRARRRGPPARGSRRWRTSGKAGSHVEVLDRGFRVPASVIEYAAQLLPHMAPGLGAPVSVRDNPGRLHVERTDRRRRAVARGRGRGRGAGGAGLDRRHRPRCAGAQPPRRRCSTRESTTGCSAATTATSTTRSTSCPPPWPRAWSSTGSLVLEPAAIAAAEPDERTGLRRLYVVLTRAVSALTVVHSEPLPVALAPQDVAV